MFGRPLSGRPLSGGWRLGTRKRLLLGGAQGGAAILLSASTVAEGAANGTLVGTLSVSGATGTPAFTLDDDAGGLFVLDGNDLEVAGTLDYETASSQQVTVSVSGVTPSISPTTFTITVTDVNELDFSNPDNSQYIGQVV